jgi:prepilin-type N-terminal cleavage/methylation domain-containing protein
MKNRGTHLKNRETHRLLADRRGVSLVEILVALTILAGALISLSGAAALAARHLQSGRTDLNAWAASQSQAEDLMSRGFDTISSGTATVHGYPMKWTVSGTNPKKIVLEMGWTNTRGNAVTDTVVLYMAQPDTTS